MRSLLLTAAGAALALPLLMSAPADAIIMPAPAGVLRSAEFPSAAQPVHCLKYVHRHSRGHDLGLGCGEETETETVAPRPSGRGSGGAASPSTLPRVSAPAPVGRPPGNYVNPNNPQDRSGNSNPQDMRQPRAINPQDMR
jgi:hypothetical protein